MARGPTFDTLLFLGKKLVDDKLQILKEHRHEELAARQEAYR